MRDFGFNILQKCEFGMGALKKLPEFLKQCGSDSVFIVSDRGLEAIGVVQKVRDIVDGAGMKRGEFLDVLPNPTVDIVNDCAEAYKKSGCTAWLALGGGSPMDVAKAAGIVAKFGGSITDYEGGGKIPGDIDPIIAVPTTAGTGSEVTVFTVITDESRNYKLTAFGPQISPKYSILDPELIMTAPPSIAAACGIDAFIHAMEAYLNTDATWFTDAMGEKAMELIGKYIRRFVANRQDAEAAQAMMVASTFAGVAFAFARLGNIHAMSHPLSAYYHVAHGVANAALMPTILEYNKIGDREGRYAKVYECVTGKRAGADFDPQMTVDAIIDLNKAIGIPTGILAAAQERNPNDNITADDMRAKFSVMAADAMKSGNVLVNPRRSTQKDIEALYEKALFF